MLCLHLVTCMAWFIALLFWYPREFQVNFSLVLILEVSLRPEFPRWSQCLQNGLVNRLKMAGGERNQSDVLKCRSKLLLSPETKRRMLEISRRQAVSMAKKTTELKLLMNILTAELTSLWFLLNWRSWTYGVWFWIGILFSSQGQNGASGCLVL